MIALTGHTSGIGKELYKSLGPSCLGFSKSEGYDITTKDGRCRIIDESKHCKIFINNACDNFGQSELLVDIFLKWHNLTKIIVNVGSRAADDDYIIKSKEYFHFLTYQMYKRNLKNLCKDLSYAQSKLQIKYVSFGRVGTEKMLKKYPGSTEHISVDTAVQLIKNSFEGEII